MGNEGSAGRTAPQSPTVQESLVEDSVSKEALIEVFPKAPLREVDFEVRFGTRLRVSAELWKLQDQLVRDYPIVGIEPGFQGSSAASVFQNIAAGRLMRVSHENFAICFTKYQQFEIFKEEVLQKVTMFCKTFDIGELTRVGLRYINDIPLLDYRPASLLEVVRPLTDFSRIPIGAVDQFVNEVRISFRNHWVTLRTALMATPEAGNRVYVLDIDCHSREPVNSGNIAEVLDDFHDAAQRFFLSHVTEKCKARMRTQS